MSLHAGAAISGTYTAASGIFTAGATTLDLTDATSFAGGSVRFGSSTSIIYDAANSIGVRNGTNAQTFAVYNTFTAGTPDYERLEMFWTSNTAIIRTAISGTGTARNLIVRYGATAGNAILIPIAVNSEIQMAPVSSSSAATEVSIGFGAALSATSGTNISLHFRATFSDGGTTSTTVDNVLSLTPTINYTAASKTGKVVLAYFNPTNTSLPTGQSCAIGLSTTATALGGIVLNNVADEDTNYEKLQIYSSSNVFTIQSINGGSGTVRNIALVLADATGSAVVVHSGTSTIAGAVTDGYTAGLRLTPTYNAGTAQTVTRHNYIDINQITLGGAGPAAVTDAAVFRFNAAAGTHKAVDSGTTKTSPGTVTQWIKANVNGTIAYIPSYSSKTS